MDENLVGYLLNSLDDAERQEVEAYLAKSPEARRRLKLLRGVLEPLALTRQGAAPPADLWYSTLARVAEHSTRELPQAPSPLAGRVAAADRPKWRRLDVLVAACLLITILGVGIPWVLHLRGSRTAQLVDCQNNLREFFQALKGYHQVHHTFPNVQTEGEPRNIAGMMVPMLVDKGVLNPAISVRCPGSGPPHPCPLTLVQARQLPDKEFLEAAPRLLSCYAYSLGYRDKDVYFPPHLDPEEHINSMLPLMADRPPTNPLQGNSNNHGGRGQNVLYQDGHVTFTTSRLIGWKGDDIYLNKDNKMAAGRDRRDTVLGHSMAKP